MTATLDDVTKKSKREPTAEERAAEEMVARAREQGLSLTGPDGLLKQLTKTVLETALNQELTEHLGHEKHGQPVAGNVRNGACACRKPRPRHATRRYSLIRQAVQVCLRMRYRARSTGSGRGFSGAAASSDRCGRC